MSVTINDITVGDVIDYRGFPARVSHVWKAEGDPRERGITDPMGMVIEWVDGGGNEQRTRIVWPDFSAPEQAELDAMSEEDRAAAVDARLATDIAERTFNLWSE